MASDKAIYVSCAIICIALSGIVIELYGIHNEMDEQTLYLSNLVVPATGDFDGEGLNNDIAIARAGKIVFINGNLTRSIEKGAWFKQEKTGVSFYRNQALHNLSES